MFFPVTLFQAWAAIAQNNADRVLLRMEIIGHPVAASMKVCVRRERELVRRISAFLALMLLDVRCHRTSVLMRLVSFE
jgi:hypothetical protein